ncbi:MAG TPA: 4Fe-4S dicluster domain-containing protein [Candidatus Brocadiia bacterium]|nr:4Fe-4S binding protein [Planctomycetota bacterium]MDO8093227.1 4Fe-4S binding protein [Candidatus Brocadiales bacterium]
MRNIEINNTLCKGCYICVEICPVNVFEKEGDVSETGFVPVLVKHPDKCTRCMLCELQCPDMAITVK